MARKHDAEARELRRREFFAAVEQGGMSLRDAVRGYRRMLGKNQADFAKMVGVPKRTLLAFEQGHGNPTLATVRKMLRGSGLDLAVVRAASVTRAVAAT